MIFLPEKLKLQECNCHLMDHQGECSFLAGLRRGCLPPSLAPCSVLLFVQEPFWVRQNNPLVKYIQAPLLSWEAEGKTKEWLVFLKPKFTSGTPRGDSFSSLCMPMAGTPPTSRGLFRSFHAQTSAGGQITLCLLPNTREKGQPRSPFLGLMM